ncbi:leucine rich repeat (LRR) protein [Prosthecobacter fusiformis]|uniref:Leucine rich repeat (LRR) protein n=1 Tax=Prosthecobacter fusiformis TaxID=48464 RepID=A0A4R7RJY2_9BACT|nr:c-type cytochrome domain-containing protein [Prosthecobacter fusiformis]TDU63216.1 leucine rich repeat (LRR) protein [Prosthecobacter fusiformis]
MSSASLRLTFLALGAAGLTPPLQAAVDFEKQIFPVLEAKCLGCHSAPHMEDGKMKKPKADLRLDAAWAMLKGAESGPSLVPGNLAKSYMYEVVTLPKDDDMFMPPKGDPLTEGEIKLLKEWIESGADFGGWKGNMEGAPQEAATPAVAKVREHEVFYKKLEEGVKPADAAAMEKAKAAGVQLATLKMDSALLRADFLTGVSKCTDESVTVLLPLKENIAQLDLGRTVITDEALKTVAQFPRMASLDLRQTKVTDAGLKSLSGLKNLQNLNLFGTEVTDKGVKELAAIKSLKTVSLFQTKATAAGVKELTDAIPGIKVTLK